MVIAPTACSLQFGCSRGPGTIITLWIQTQEQIMAHASGSFGSQNVFSHSSVLIEPSLVETSAEQFYP